MSEIPRLPPELGDSLRQSAPVLPSSLKSRTLQNCTAQRMARHQRHQRLNRQLAWAVAAVLTLQTLSVFLVDAQTNQLLAGNGATPSFPAVTLAEVSELWHQRSVQIAQLIGSSKIG
jgi:hypothetical protein